MEQVIETSIFDDMDQKGRYEQATMGQRLANYIIDFIVFFILLCILMVIVGVVIGVAGGDGSFFESESRGAIYLIVYTSMVLIYALIEGLSKGRSLGKVITGTRAVGENMSPITWKQAFVRSLVRIVPFEALSALGGTPWHDKWSKTMVIKNGRRI